jgi:hypothetical protein
MPRAAPSSLQYDTSRVSAPHHDGRPTARTAAILAARTLALQAEMTRSVTSDHPFFPSHIKLTMFEDVTIHDVTNLALIQQISSEILNIARQQVHLYDTWNDDEDSDTDEDSSMSESDHVKEEDADDNFSLGECDDDGDQDKDMGGLGNKIVGFRFVDLETYRLMEDGLPSGIDGFKIIREVRNGYLYIRTVPGMVHEKASRAYEIPIGNWAQNNILVADDDPPLISTGSAGMRSSILSANCVRL